MNEFSQHQTPTRSRHDVIANTDSLYLQRSTEGPDQLPRMLPETKAVPKELPPVGGKPAIQWALDEAKGAGIDRFVVVSSRHKPSIEAYLLGAHDACDHFDWREQPHRADLSDGHIEIVYQPLAKGLGDAVRTARSVLGTEPFALLLRDEILLGGARLLRVMIEDFTRTGRSGVSLLQVDRADIGSYGCAAVKPSPENHERFLATACLETHCRWTRLHLSPSLAVMCSVPKASICSTRSSLTTL